MSVVPQRDDAREFVLGLGDEVQEVARGDVAANCLLSDRLEEQLRPRAVRRQEERATEALDQAADSRSISISGTSDLHSGLSNVSR